MTATSEQPPRLDDTAGLIHVRRPSDGTHIADLLLHRPADIAETAIRLRAAQPEWERIGVESRIEWLQSYRQWIVDNTDRLIEIGADEGGRVRNEPMLETTLLVELIDYYSRAAPKLLRTRRIRPGSPLVLGKKLMLHRHPYQLVGVIGAWNFPMLLTIGDALPALFAGAAVMVKPSEVTPLAVRELLRGWEDICAPPVLEAAYGGAAVGGAVVDEADFVQFTGSVATGKRILERAAATITPVSLELGGKDPCLVLAGANLERAANCAVYGGFSNNGQVCMGFERVYVEDSVYDRFVDLVVSRVRALRCGIGDDSDVGALTFAPQLDIVDAQVRDAVARGARVLTGGHRVEGEGTWYAPTVLTDVDHSMAIMREETFGPVLPIMRVTGQEEAIRLANDTEFGLSATVFAEDKHQAEQIAARLEVGAVNIGDFLINMTCVDAPQGGWKRSGLGSRGGEYGLLKYTRTKVVANSRIPTGDREINWFPYTPARRRAFRGAVRLIHGRGLGRFGF
ncbi:aldehyde dehydrogenase family protein [Nocardia gamkensis]|uniref:Aldehyde dehydrogenase family protein n=1 Tax=Nocardia gamkensis TaxID=352869 RepID=A0A7X6L9Y7_9NOCA|nr:aldehyde dehydrogenase family protein [Nocardia gamkensis]NKY30573.1 aldehyde dehydrogenase family protein [Nocardia gamkensis]NQE70557.1 Fatty aldehyde dehydrogenase HFD1 [Nocardia gamkensis]